jgi:hypothetical protein
VHPTVRRIARQEFEVLGAPPREHGDPRFSTEQPGPFLLIGGDHHEQPLEPGRSEAGHVRMAKVDRIEGTDVETDHDPRTSGIGSTSTLNPGPSSMT